MEKDYIEEEIATKKICFNKACKQMILLNEKMHLLMERYYRAERAGHRSLRYNLRLRIAIVDALRRVYFEYASVKKEEADTMLELLNNREKAEQMEGTMMEIDMHES